MMTEISVRGVIATIEAGSWYCDDASVKKECEAASVTLDSHQYYPDRDLAVATHVADILGGEVVTVTPLPKAPPGTIF